jgi:hypothetical protein
MKCLIVKPPFANYIVNGIKTIEYRSRKTNIRGRIGIIESGSSTILGDVQLIDCTYNPDIYLWEWVLCSPNKYAYSVYIHRKKGAIIWEEVNYTPEGRLRAMPDMYCYDAYEEEEKCHEIEQEFIKEYVKKTYGLQK